MNITGDHHIPATPEVVWQALNDPAVLKVCVPGCEEMTKQSDTDFTAKVVVKIGPVKARFGGRVTLGDIVPASQCRLTLEGEGGAAGFVKGTALVNLNRTPEGTILTYQAEASIGGKLAQIGSRLVEGTARKLAEEFFGAFVAQVAPSPDHQPASPSPEEDSRLDPARGLPLVVWLGGLFLTLGSLSAYFTL